MSMNEFFQALSTAEDKGFGAEGFAAFDQLLNLFPDDRTNELISTHRESKNELLQLFESDRALSQHLQNFVLMYLEAVDDEYWWGQPWGTGVVRLALGVLVGSDLGFGIA